MELRDDEDRLLPSGASQLKYPCVDTVSLAREAAEATGMGSLDSLGGSSVPLAELTGSETVGKLSLVKEPLKSHFTHFLKQESFQDQWQRVAQKIY